MTISYTIPCGKYDDIEAHDECAVYPPNGKSTNHPLHGVMISRYTFRFDDSDSESTPIDEDREYETVFGATPFAVVAIVRALGLEFEDSTTQHATDPDGSRYVNPADDLREELTATVFGFSATTYAIIREALSTRTVGGLSPQNAAILRSAIDGGDL